MRVTGTSSTSPWRRVGRFMAVLLLTLDGRLVVGDTAPVAPRDSGVRRARDADVGCAIVTSAAQFRAGWRHRDEIDLLTVWAWRRVEQLDHHERVVVRPVG